MLFYITVVPCIDRLLLFGLFSKALDIGLCKFAFSFRSFVNNYISYPKSNEYQCEFAFGLFLYTEVYYYKKVFLNYVTVFGRAIVGF